MSGILSPADERLIGVGRGRMLGAGTSALLPMRSLVPQVDQYLQAWQQQNLGRTIDPLDRELINRIGQTLSGRPLIERETPLPFTVNLDERERTPGTIDWNPAEAFRHGFDETPIGAFRRWAAIDGAVNIKADPDYDPWRDPAVTKGPFRDRPELFETSRSAEESAWIVRYMQRHEKESRRLEAMSGHTGLFELAGSMLGDPLSYTPATLGFRGAHLAARAAMMGGPEAVELGFRPVIWGGVKDSLRAAGAQVAIALADAGVQRALDPSYQGGSIADLAALPAALAGAVGFLTGAYGRYQLGMHALERAGGNEAFLAATRARASNPAAGENLSGTGLLSPAEREAWERAVSANPGGRFHVDGVVVGPIGDGEVLFRTAQGLDAVVPTREIDRISELSGRGIAVSGRALLGSEALMGSAMKLDGEFSGGGRVVLRDQTAVGPGSLASDYPAMRAEELVRDGTIGNLDDVEIAKGSLSAANVGSAASRKAQLAGNRLVASGIGLEKLPLDVINRAAMLPFTTWQTTVEDMLSAGGRLRAKNTKAFGFERSGDPVEILIRTQWLRPTMEVVRSVRDEWQLYRAGHASVDPTDLERIGFEMKTAVTDRLGRTKGMSFEAFRRRVGDALINGDKDLLSDAATPQVEAAAGRTRQLLERIKREGTDTGLFREAHEEQLAQAEAKVAGLKKNPATSPDVLAAAEKRVDAIKQLLADVVAGGPSVNTAKSYRPRIWLHDRLVERADEFKQIVDDWLRQTQPALSAQRRREIAIDIHETLLRDKPVWERKELQTLFADLADPGSAKARTFAIPDMLVRDFLENDVEAIVRSHGRIMGTAIEMHRRFGSTGMEDQIAELRAEAKKLYDAAPDNETRKRIVRQRDLAQADLEASRDRLYGVYGAPDDPHRWSSRAVRMAKQYTNLTVLGMSGITAMADLVRPLMTEGLLAVHDYGLRTMMAQSRGLILKMSRRELELAGDGMELINNTRALSMSDAGDMFRSRTPAERGLAKANSWFFVLNGLNAINQIDKEWAGVIIQGNVNRAILAHAAGSRVEDWMRARLAGAGIDESMLGRIAAEMDAKGSNRFGRLVLADTGKWTDEEAAKAYRVALNQMVNRTVPTPTLGDTPNWMSSELGGLVAQYKAFAFGALNRSLFSGLQESTNQFWYGAAAAVGFAVLLNEIRSRLFYDRSTFDKPLPAVVMDAVDRSSILGYFSDANRAVEVLTGHRAGARPLAGAERAREESGSRVVGALAGPAAGQAVNAFQVLGDFLAFHPTARTFADARQLVPGQNLPYLDPVMDRVISDGRRYPERRKPQ
jgi:hypothetical protein